ncbi:MAG: hypothetical protein KDB53_11540, partial [Planctomycetes bacterium]|nr:hypothetical protein [Planctomycetota bacterium]
RGCQLGGRVLLDEGIATGAITVNLAGEFERDIRQPPTAPAWSADAVLELITHGRDQDIGPDGHFEFEAIPAGEAVVTVYASQTEVFKSRPITLRRGDSASPKELAAIDLRGLLTTRRIAVADASSKPIDGALVRFWSDDMRQGPVETLTDEQGIAHVTSVGNKPINLHIKGPPEGNWTPASLESVAATATATLQHPPMVRVTIKNPEALPRPPYFLSCVLTPVDIQDDDKRSPFGMSESGAIFDGTGVGEVAVEKPGKYEVRMNVWAIMPDLGWDCPLEFEGPHIVELAGDGSDHFQIDVARGAWIDAISQTTRIVFR